MTFKEILTQFETTPVESVDMDLFYEDTGLTDEQIAQLRAELTRLAVQGDSNE